MITPERAEGGAGSNTDIAIAGGGLVGASIALMLAKLLPEHTVSLFDRHALQAAKPEHLAQPSFDARSTALSPSSIAFFKRLGLWSELQSHATPIEKIHVTDRGHIGHVCLTQADNGQQALGYVIGNAALGWALTGALQSCANLSVRAPSTVQSVRINADGAQLRLSNDESLSAELLIVADGAQSELRAQLGIAASVRSYGQHAIVANVSTGSAHNNMAFERFTGNGPMALLPIAGGQGRRMAMIWSWPNEQSESAMVLSDAEFLARLQATFGYRLGRFTAISERSAYPLNLVLAKEQVRRHVVIMGNAAHYLHPVAGQGFNLAVRDAQHLAQVLVSAGTQRLGELSLLQRYVQAQSEDQFKTVLLSDGFHYGFSNRNPLKVAARSAMMAAVQHSKPVRKAFIARMSGRASPAGQPWEKN